MTRDSVCKNSLGKSQMDFIAFNNQNDNNKSKSWGMEII